jgi:gliding motility-associated lipoprotein GldH
MKILLKNKYLFGVIVAFLATITSCDKNEAYHQFQDIKNASWSKTDSANFLIDTTSFLPGNVYDIDLEIVNNTQFHYQNLWLFVRSNIENEKVFRQDTIQIKLADIYGKWLGSGFGSYYQTATSFRRRVVFSQRRNYTIQVIQGMRDEPLTGIEKVGFRISRAQ